MKNHRCRTRIAHSRSLSACSPATAACPAARPAVVHGKSIERSAGLMSRRRTDRRPEPVGGREGRGAPPSTAGTPPTASYRAGAVRIRHRTGRQAHPADPQPPLRTHRRRVRRRQTRCRRRPHLRRRIRRRPQRDEACFQPYTPPTATNLHDDVVFDGGNYYRTFDPIYTFGYNTALVDADQAPSGMEGPAQRAVGKLGIAQAGAGGSALALTRFQRDVLGDDYLRQYAPNTRVFDSLGAELDALARGEIEAGTVVVSSVNIAGHENAPVNFVVPKEGLTAYDYYTGMASTATNTCSAARSS